MFWEFKSVQSDMLCFLRGGMPQGLSDWIGSWTNWPKRWEWRVNSDLDSVATGKPGESPSFILTNLFLEMLTIRLARELNRSVYFLFFSELSHSPHFYFYDFMHVLWYFSISFPHFSPKSRLLTTKCSNRKHIFVQDSVRSSLHFCFALPKWELFFLLRCFQPQN